MWPKSFRTKQFVEGTLPSSGQVSSLKTSSVQGTISAFENLNDEIRTEGDYNSTRSPERLDFMAHTIANALLLPIVQKEASGVVESVALLNGWGANCKGIGTSSIWKVNKVQCHINFLKLKVACLAI